VSDQIPFRTTDANKDITQVHVSSLSSINYSFKQIRTNSFNFSSNA